ncbi:MAG TPA: hypothetical protein VM734_09060 [Kofleriaceae bacterium]|nr:hypothetical protein [Kofleriaceae bacterium]
MRTALALLPLAVGLAAPAAAQPAPSRPPLAEPARPHDPRVAVVVELAVNVEATRVEALSAALADALNRELEVDAFGGGDVERRLPAGGLPDDCLATPACIADVAARLDAPQLLVIAVVQVGDDIQVDSSWVDVARGEVSARPRVTLPADARAGEVFADAAARLLPRATRRPLSVVQPIEVVTPTGPSRRFTTGAKIAAAAGVVALGGGIGVGLSARASYGRCDKVGTVCSDGEKDSIGTRALIADALFVGAAAGVTTAVILYLRSADGSEQVATGARPARSLTVTPTAGGAVVGLHGGF